MVFNIKSVTLQQADAQQLAAWHTSHCQLLVGCSVQKSCSLCTTVIDAMDSRRPVDILSQLSRQVCVRPCAACRLWPNSCWQLCSAHAQLRQQAQLRCLATAPVCAAAACRWEGQALGLCCSTSCENSSTFSAVPSVSMHTWSCNRPAAEQQAGRQD